MHCLYLTMLFILLDTSTECPPGMVYQQCGSLCPQTCDNIGTLNCQGGCAEGCFCPDGQVFYNRNCINPILCQGMYMLLNG